MALLGKLTQQSHCLACPAERAKPSQATPLDVTHQDLAQDGLHLWIKLSIIGRTAYYQSIILEDISQDVWDDIIRQWEEEEAAGTDEEVYEEEYYEEDEGWIYDEVTGEYYDPEELEGVYYGAYTEENY